MSNQSKERTDMIMTPKDALEKIAAAPKGNARAQLLQDENFRALVLNSGANVTIFSGKMKSGDTFEKRLEDVYVGLIQRKNRKGNYDGLGALGGLAERTTAEQFEKMSNDDKQALVGKKDDVIIEGNQVCLIDDIDIIRQNNVLREMREELGDLGISGVEISPLKLQLVAMPKVKDDNYMINIWNGDGPCFAVNPYCHLYPDDGDLLAMLSKNATEQSGGEASAYKKIPLFKALSCYGHPAGDGAALEDGRSATKDYRYPHEYLAVWFLASELLEHNPEAFLKLTSEVQQSVQHLISFDRLARATGQSLKDVAEVLRVPVETLQQSDKQCANMTNKRHGLQHAGHGDR